MRCPTQENVLAEADMMVPETLQRLEAAFADLQSFLVSARTCSCKTASCSEGLLSTCAQHPCYNNPATAFELQADNQSDIPAGCEELTAAQEVTALVQATLQA